MYANDHLTEFNKIICELLRFDASLEEEDTVLLAISSFPPPHEHLVTALLYEKDKIDMKDVTTSLLSN